MLKRIILIIILLTAILTSKQSSEEVYDYLYKKLESKSESKLMNHLLNASLNCNDKVDINVFVTLRVLEKRGNNAVPLLGEALFDDKYCDQVKIQILNTLYEIHSDEVIPYLQKAAKHKNKDISIEATRVLSSFDGYTADVLIDNLLDVKGDDRKTFKVLQGFALRAYSHLRGNKKAYDVLVPFILDETLDISLRRIALISLAGINIQRDEILSFCRKIIPDDQIESGLRTDAMYVVSRFKKVEFIDLIYDTIVNTSDVQVVQKGLFQLTEFQHPMADEKIGKFKELMNSEKYLDERQKSVSKYYSTYESKYEDGGKSENEKIYSTDIRYSYLKFVRLAESNIKRMNEAGVKIP